MSSPDWAIDGKSSSSVEDVNWNWAPVWAANARPFRNVLLVPNGRSCVEKLKLPWVVVMLKVAGVAVSEILTMSPFSCTGPGGFNEGDSRVLNFQLVVPEMASVPLNRQPRRIWILLRSR